MHYRAFVTDFDGTIASYGNVDRETILALYRLRQSGRRVILATGRFLDNLLSVCPEFGVFDYILAEDGAVLYRPSDGETTILSDPLPKRLMDALREAKVEPLYEGSVICSTVASEKTKILEAIQKVGLEVQIVFNGGSLMVVPVGGNKASGLDYVLRKLGLSFHEVVGVGDAENDYSFLQHCECPVAVQNAIESIKDIAVLVTNAPAGAGVQEVVAGLIKDDLSGIGKSLTRNSIVIGTLHDGSPFGMPVYGENVLVVGPPGAGKSDFASGFIERLIRKDYQVCVIDPEGDYVSVRELITLGSTRHTPRVSEVVGLLQDPEINGNVNLLGIPMSDRPEYFSQLFLAIQGLRTRTGRPHWIIMDEAHHLVPAAFRGNELALPRRFSETMLLTVNPDQLSSAILKMMDTVVAVGASPENSVARFASAVHKQPPKSIEGGSRESSGSKTMRSIRSNEIVVWPVRSGSPAIRMKVIPGRLERLRHLRKYAEGDLGSHSFYFRGPQGKQNLKAQNVLVFAQIAEGIDEETWLFHLRRGDYSRWLKEHVKDEEIAKQMEKIEQEPEFSSEESRQRASRLIRSRFTAPEDRGILAY